MRLLHLLVALLSLLLSYSDAQSKWERRYPFKWDSVLRNDVAVVYADSNKIFYRLAQLYAESAFNPRATSDFGGWYKTGLDTASAILQRKGAAGIAQFIWPTAVYYGALTVNTRQAEADTFATDIYNIRWSINACCRYMKSNELLMKRTRNPAARRKLVVNEMFSELCATAGYNTGPGKLLKLLNQTSRWQVIKLKILQEPREYSEKIVAAAKEMKQSGRWSK